MLITHTEPPMTDRELDKYLSKDIITNSVRTMRAGRYDDTQSLFFNLGALEIEVANMRQRLAESLYRESVVTQILAAQEKQS